MLNTHTILHIDNLSLVMMGLVGFVALCVISFSYRYLDGDTKQPSFYRNLIGMVLAVYLMVSADHIILMLGSWVASNLFLSRLMRHKKQWRAAKQSYFIALMNFGVGFIFLSTALCLLYAITGETSIQGILKTTIETPWLMSCSLLILLAAMTQSSLWPFHTWLTSSLNSPTPVSAIMHAGLVNGGGYLLARFSPLLSEQLFVLNIIFLAGIMTALLGTLWKLMQSDIKRMLACSTMGQMGFMIAQCGLGLFPAAIAHLCWHGLFKAYLFFASGSAAQEKRLDLDYPPSLKCFLTALLCGLCGSYMFSFVSNKDPLALNTTCFLVILAIISGTQFALPIVRSQLKAKFLIAFIATTFMGSFYGMSVHFIELALAPLNLSKIVPLNALHILALFILVFAWLSILLGRRPVKRTIPNWLVKAYVYMLNASQPHPKTITVHHNHYQF